MNVMSVSYDAPGREPKKVKTIRFTVMVIVAALLDGDDIQCTPRRTAGDQRSVSIPRYPERELVLHANADGGADAVDRNARSARG